MVFDVVTRPENSVVELKRQLNLEFKVVNWYCLVSMVGETTDKMMDLVESR